MLCPCDRCKRSKCPDVCYPLIDYDRAMQKRYGKKTKTTVPKVPGPSTRVSR